MKKISGVYKITNEITGDFYIGSSKNIKERWYSHRKISRWKKYPNSRMYQDMARYGKDNFLFDIIEETQGLFEREQYWIELLKPTYNINRAKGIDIERKKHTNKLYYKTHRNKILDSCKSYYHIHKEEKKAYNKEWCNTHKKDKSAYNKEYYSRLCSYNDEILTLGNLSRIFTKFGIERPVQEAKKYLIKDKGYSWPEAKKIADECLIKED